MRRKTKEVFSLACFYYYFIHVPSAIRYGIDLISEQDAIEKIELFGLLNLINTKIYLFSQLFNDILL